MACSNLWQQHAAALAAGLERYCKGALFQNISQPDSRRAPNLGVRKGAGRVADDLPEDTGHVGLVGESSGRCRGGQSLAA